eukprot:523821-Hanusia_phi.AAC.2
MLLVVKAKLLRRMGDKSKCVEASRAALQLGVTSSALEVTAYLPSPPLLLTRWGGDGRLSEDRGGGSTGIPARGNVCLRQDVGGGGEE